MKKIQSFTAFLGLFIAFNACKNDDTNKKNVDNFSQYVDSVEQVTPVYSDSNWETIESGYKTRETQATMNMDALEASEKEKIENTRAKYNSLKNKYEGEMKKSEAKATAAAPDYRMILRGNLFGEGKMGADMKFNWITANNILEVYERFVNTVDDNKNNYTREDWDEIKLLYEGIDSRKNEVEKDLAGKDNIKIAALKVKFAAIKSIKRPQAKAEENEKSKD